MSRESVAEGAAAPSLDAKWQVFEAPGKGARISVKFEWCKGCKICVVVCEEGVLVMRDGKAVPGKIEACTVCRACEEHCPDFAIRVEKGAKESSP
jgi:2-oxoglutarate ferredoxin oxidoreductase subunit delta